MYDISSSTCINFITINRYVYITCLHIWHSTYSWRSSTIKPAPMCLIWHYQSSASNVRIWPNEYFRFVEQPDQVSLFPAGVHAIIGFVSTHIVLQYPLAHQGSADIRRQSDSNTNVDVKGTNTVKRFGKRLNTGSKICCPSLSTLNLSTPTVLDTTVSTACRYKMLCVPGLMKCVVHATVWSLRFLGYKINECSHCRVRLMCSSDLCGRHVHRPLSWPTKHAF